MSPIAICTVVDVVGAQMPKDTSSGSWRGVGSSIPSCSTKRGQSAAFRWEVMATTERSGERCLIRLSSSPVRPLNETNSKTSFWRRDGQLTIKSQDRYTSIPFLCPQDRREQPQQHVRSWQRFPCSSSSRQSSCPRVRSFPLRI